MKRWTLRKARARQKRLNESVAREILRLRDVNSHPDIQMVRTAEEYERLTGRKWPV